MSLSRDSAGSGGLLDGFEARPTGNLSRFVFALMSDMAASASNQQHDRRKHDHVKGKHEQRRVPDEVQQSQSVRNPPQDDDRDPGGDYQYGNRRDIHTEQVDLRELHSDTPASK